MAADLSEVERDALLKWWPPGVFQTSTELEDIGIRGALAQCQTGFQPLQAGRASDTIIRLTRTDWSFQPPMAISIEEEGGRRRVRVGRLWYPEGSWRALSTEEPINPRAEIYRSRPVPPEVWRSLTDVLRQLDFDEVPEWVEESGADGNHYIFEIAHGDTYHVLVRWSPYEGPLASLEAELMRWRLPDTLLPPPGDPAERIIHAAPR